MVQYNSFCSWGWLETLDRGHARLRRGRARATCATRSVRALVKGTDVVCHLAALIAIPYSYQAPRSYLDTNVGGTLNVLEAVRHLGIPRIGAHVDQRGLRHRPHRADHRGPPAAGPVARTRRRRSAADKLAESYHLSFDLPVVTLRPFNTYGPRQSARAVIPTVIVADRRRARGRSRSGR